MSEYAKRDIEAQGEHYLRHLAAMTAEGLHSKSDIAAELAHRDMAIMILRLEIIAQMNCREQGFAARDEHIARLKEEIDAIVTRLRWAHL